MAILDKMEYKKLQIEHIAARNYVVDRGKLRASGFKHRGEFGEYVDLIGNLTILERGINVNASDKSPLDKAKLYLGTGRKKGSKLKINEKLAFRIQDEFKGFNKDNLLTRNKELKEFIQKKWHI